MQEYEAEDDGPPSMAPPPLPPDYGGGGGGGFTSTNTAQNELLDMGWSKPAAAKPQPTTASNTITAVDDDWGNAGWGFPTNNTAAGTKPPENNFQQAGGNHQTSGFTNDFTSSSSARIPSNTAANTNQVPLYSKPCVCCFVAAVFVCKLGTQLLGAFT